MAKFTRVYRGEEVLPTLPSPYLSHTKAVYGEERPLFWWVVAVAVISFLLSLSIVSFPTIAKAVW